MESIIFISKPSNQLVVTEWHLAEMLQMSPQDLDNLIRSTSSINTDALAEISDRDYRRVKQLWKLSRKYVKPHFCLVLTQEELKKILSNPSLTQKQSNALCKLIKEFDRYGSDNMRQLQIERTKFNISLSMNIGLAFLLVFFGLYHFSLFQIETFLSSSIGLVIAVAITILGVLIEN